MVAAASAAASGGSRSARFVRGVEVGVQSWCFNDRPFEEMIAGLVEAGAGSVELWSGHLEPSRQLRGDRDALRRWRLAVDLEEFRKAREALDAQGVHLAGYNVSMRRDWTDGEIEKAFQMAAALGTDLITSSSNVSTAARIDPFARRHGIRVGFHNHARVKDDEFATPDDFRKGMAGFSDFLGVNLDTGHFTAAGYDPLSFLREHHDRVFSLHMKDRAADDGPKLPFGQGDTPLRGILRLLSQEGWPIPAHVEFAYPAEDRVAETRRNLEWMKRALEDG